MKDLHKLRHGEVQRVMLTKGSDMHRGMGQRSETRVSKGKTTKKKKTYTCCAGARTDAGGLGQHGKGSVSQANE
jgi:hypothetical protein